MKYSQVIENSVLGWSNDPWSWNEVRTLLHIIMYYYISTDSTHTTWFTCKYFYIHKTLFPIEQWKKFTRQHFSEKDWKMQLLRVHIPENVQSPSPKFSWSGLRSCLVMTCLAKHAPLENLRSCDRSMQSQPCAASFLAGDMYLDIFSSWCLLQSACTYFTLIKLHDL